MSSKGNLATKEYAYKCVELAKNHKNAIGVISQSRLDDTKLDLIHMTPGVKIADSEDNLGQQYNTPEEAVIEKGADIIIVGRGITQAEDPEDTGKSFSEALLFPEHGEKMCTKIVLNVRNNFCTQHVLPRFRLGIFMY